MTQVTGILTDELGAVLANTTCAVVAVDQVVGQDGGGRVSRGSIVVTDGAGEFDADIKPGRYELVVEASAPADANVKFSRIGRMTVHGDTMTLEAALDRNAEPVTPTLVQQAIDAKDAAEAAAVLAQSAYQGRQYATIAEFEADVAAGYAPVNGTVISVAEYHAGTGRGGGAFRLDTASTDTPDGGKVFAASGGGRWHRLGAASVYDVTHYGATGRKNKSLDPVAIQAAAAALVVDAKQRNNGGFVELHFPAGVYWITDEIDLSGGLFSGAKNVSVTGSGMGVTSIQCGEIGNTKAMLKLSNFGVAEATEEVTVRGITLSGEAFTRLPGEPMGIFAPNNRRLVLEDVETSNLGNTGIYATRNFNSDFINVRVTRTGWGYLEKTLSDTVRFSMGLGSDVVTASEAVFEASDVGRVFYVHRASVPVNGVVQNQARACTITAFNSSTEVTVDFLTPVAVVSERGCFDHVRGSISAASDVVTLNAPVLAASDVGRLVYIPDAGDNRIRVLHSRIVEVISPTQCRLAASASNTATSQYVLFAVSIHCGSQPDEETQEGLGVNDIKMSHVHLEGNWGGGLFLGSGVHAFIDKLKVHGRPSSSGEVGYTKWHIINAGCQYSLFDHLHLEFGAVSKTDGIILALGQNCHTSIYSGTWGSETVGPFFADFRCTDEMSLFHIGSLITNLPWQLSAGPIKRAASGSRVSVTGDIHSPTSESRRSVLRPREAQSFRGEQVVMAPGAIITIPADMQTGFLTVSTIQGIEEYAHLRFRSTSSPARRDLTIGTACQVYNNTDLAVSPGTGDLNIAINKGAIQVRNGAASNRTLSWSILG